MRNPTLATHTPVAIAMTSLFQFQMAILTMLMSDCLGKMVIVPQIHNKTYMRSTIKSDAAAKATYAKNYKKKNFTNKHSLVFIPHTGRIRRHSHKLEDVLDLRIIAYQGTGAHGIEDTTYLAIGVGYNVQTDELNYDH